MDRKAVMAIETTAVVAWGGRGQADMVRENSRINSSPRGGSDHDEEGLNY